MSSWLTPNTQPIGLSLKVYRSSWTGAQPAPSRHDHEAARQHAPVWHRLGRRTPATADLLPEHYRIVDLLEANNVPQAIELMKRRILDWEPVFVSAIIDID
jgi:DNA-binding GntR family transcriptional regulator